MSGADSTQLVVAQSDAALDSTVELTTDRAYALWSETYDSAPNPMLALEERYLVPMLPSLAGKAVLDLGCGTCRFSEQLSRSGPGQYLGIDRSAAMLTRAAKKPGVAGHLLRADCLKLPLSSRSADVILCSFVLGYVELREFAAEIQRVATPRADVYMSEFHPESLSLGWKRSFRARDRVIELRTASYSVQEVEEAFRSRGFDVVQRVEPAFGEPERHIFLSHGKGRVFESASGTPAIFICHLRRSERAA